MFLKNIFAQRVKLLRTTLGISQQDLGDVLGVTKHAISMIENEKRAASIEIVVALADYFNVSTDYLLGRTDNPETNK